MARKRRKIIKVDKEAVTRKKVADAIESIALDTLEEFDLNLLLVRFNADKSCAYIVVPRVHVNNKVNKLVRDILYVCTLPRTTPNMIYSRLKKLGYSGDNFALNDAIKDMYLAAKVSGTKPQWVEAFNDTVRTALSDIHAKDKAANIAATMTDIGNTFSDPYYDTTIPTDVLSKSLNALKAAINPPLETANYMELHEQARDGSAFYRVTKTFAVAGRHHEIGELVYFVDLAAANRYLMGSVATAPALAQPTAGDVRNASSFLSRATKKTPEKPLTLAQIKARAGLPVSKTNRTLPKTIHDAEDFDDDIVFDDDHFNLMDDHDD